MTNYVFYMKLGKKVSQNLAWFRRALRRNFCSKIKMKEVRGGDICS